jgi:hypothetical protein
MTGGRLGVSQRLGGLAAVWHVTRGGLKVTDGAGAEVPAEPVVSLRMADSGPGSPQDADGECRDRGGAGGGGGNQRLNRPFSPESARSARIRAAVHRAGRADACQPGG